MAKKTVIKESEQSEFTVGKAVFYTATLVAGVLGLRYAIKASNQQSASDSLIDDINVQLATRLRNAMTPTWWQGGTDEKALLAIAPLIANFTAVSQSYAKLYNRNLTQDLDDELGAEDLAEFLKNAKSGKRDAAIRALGRIPTPTGNLLAINSMVISGKNYAPGVTVNAKGIAGSAYNTVDRYPLSYTSLNKTAVGPYKLLQIYKYTDDLDSSKNTYLFKVQKASDTFWQRWGAFV